MSFELTFLNRARKDISSSMEWYEKKQVGLGLRFLETTYSQIDKILLNANAFSEKKKKYKESKVPHFPFVIVYRVFEKEKEISIVSVFHTSRNTKNKYKTK